MLTRYFSFMVKLAMAAMVFGMAGCATMYQSEGMTGGYIDKQLSPNKFLVTFNGNGFTTPKRSSDFALMRGAELALTHGYKYIVVFNSDTAMNEDDIWNGFTVEASFKPTSRYIILATRNPPTQFKAYFDAQKIYEDTVREYAAVDKNSREFHPPSVGHYVPDPSVIKFTFDQQTDLPPVPTDQVKVYTNLDSFMGATWFEIGWFTYYENPMNSESDFVNQVREEVAQKGADGLLIVSDPTAVQNSNLNYGFTVPKDAGFIAEALYFPRGSLGVDWEPGALHIGEYIVRTYRNNAQPQAGGLLLGDRLLDIEGVDVLKSKEVFKLEESWNPGDLVKLTVARNGHEQQVVQKLVAN